MRASWCLAAVLCACTAGVDGGEDVSVGQAFTCNIQSTGIAWMSETKAILVCQESQNTRIYVTEDRGRTWVEEVAAQCANDGQACYTNINFEDRHHAILGTGGGALEWDIGSAADLGATVRAKIDGGGSVGDLAHVRSHPTQPGTELGLQFVDPTCQRRCPSKVYLSEDYGKTWERILEDKIVEDAQWGDQAAKSFHPHEIFFIYTTHNSYSGTKDFTDLFSFNYKEETEREVLRDCFYWVNRLGFTYYVVAGQHDKNTLHVSADNGEHVAAAVFPSDQPEEKYYVLRGSAGVAFVAVHHLDCLKGNTHGWGRLYQSGTTGSRFKLALDNIRWLPNTEPDFHNVQALDGVYMANIALVDEPKCRYCASAYCASQCRYVTVISYENADPETWHKLAAPHGTKCDGDCYLHLHDAASVQSWIPQLLSKSSAPGVIVGAGNTGGSLDANDVNMYLTLDAGVSWRKILDGAHTLDWTDYGGLMVAAPTQSTTQAYHYSFDMGQTWQSETFTTLTDVRVHRVIASGGAAYANSTQAHFMLYCSHVATGKTIVFSTDLTPEQHLHPVCKMPKYGQAIKPDSDFQLFAPRGSGEECFMGQKVTFLQKKSGHQCWNPSTAGMDVYWTSKKCACTLEDYECEVGFKQNTASKLCVSRETRSVVWDTVKKKWTSPPEEDPHMPRFCVGKTYLRTKGYAMKPGFHCNPDDLDLEPEEVPCPADRQINGSSGLGIFGVFLLVIFLLFVGGVAAVYIGAHFFMNPTCIALKIVLEDVAECCMDGLCGCCAGLKGPQPTALPEGAQEDLLTDDEDDDADPVIIVAPVVVEAAAPPAAADSAVLAPPPAPIDIAAPEADDNDHDFATLRGGGGGGGDAAAAAAADEEDDDFADLRRGDAPAAPSPKAAIDLDGLFS